MVIVIDESKNVFMYKDGTLVTNSTDSEYISSSLNSLERTLNLLGKNPASKYYLFFLIKKIIIFKFRFDLFSWRN